MRREEYRQHAVVFGLVDEPGHKIAEANTVAKEVNAVADFDFENGELLAIAQADAGELKRLRRVRNGNRDGLRGRKDIRAGQNLAHHLKPRLSVVFLAKDGLDLVASHERSKDSERMMSGVVSSARGADVTGLSSACCNG